MAGGLDRTEISFTERREEGCWRISLNKQAELHIRVLCMRFCDME